MKYLIDGWHKFSFLLAPEELRNLLKGYHLIIGNAHVPAGYRESSLEEYLAAYSRLYGMLTGGERLEWNRDHGLFLHRDVTSDLSGCTYGNPHLYQGKPYLSPAFREPVPGLSPVTLSVSVDEAGLHCTTAVSYAFCTEAYMGLQLHFPKFVQYPSAAGYRPLRSTEDLASYRDFEALRRSVKKLSRALVLRAGDRERRTGLWVSGEAREALRGCCSLRQAGVTIK